MKFFNRTPKLRVFIEDLAKLSPDTKKIRIHGNAKNLAFLGEMHRLERLSVYTLNQAQLEQICLVARPKSLRLYELRATDLSPLAQLSTVEQLELNWNTKTTELWDMRDNLRLIKLSINDFSKLHDIAALSDATQLTELSLTGGIWNKLKLRSLEPLSALTSLRKLCLANLSVAQGGLKPLANLSRLEELDLSRQFDTEEYARLSVALPNTRCEYFAPYVSVKGVFPNADVQVVGRGKPLLHSKRDAERLAKYSKRFAEMQERFRNKHKI
ncbi:leucine-rich repeat domain-containing protein [Candidatus Saccharibacteria bacterium]|nr:leucine-rich repeat domain-containing protein [Candidatus Saccharibacteria bacterium]